jgi:hypothetical protein
MSSSGKWLSHKSWAGISGVVGIAALIATISVPLVTTQGNPPPVNAPPGQTVGPTGSAAAASQLAPNTASSTSPGAISRTGVVKNLDDRRGVDLDTGVVDLADDLDGRAPRSTGQDISPFDMASSFGLMSKEVVFYVLSKPGAEDYARCAEISVGWTGRPNPVHGLYKMAPGTNICFRTNAANLAMITVDRTPNGGTGTIDFHYVVWRT